MHDDGTYSIIYSGPIYLPTRFSEEPFFKVFRSWILLIVNISKIVWTGSTLTQPTQPNTKEKRNNTNTDYNNP